MQDDDCNGATDDVPGVGASCTDPGVICPRTHCMAIVSAASITE